MISATNIIIKHLNEHSEPSLGGLQPVPGRGREIAKQERVYKGRHEPADQHSRRAYHDHSCKKKVIRNVT